VSEDLVPVLQLYTEHGVRQRLDDRAFDQDRVILGLRQRASPSGLEARQRTAKNRDIAVGPWARGTGKEPTEEIT
jgi:hypothetical protein